MPLLAQPCPGHIRCACIQGQQIMCKRLFLLLLRPQEGQLDLWGESCLEQDMLAGSDIAQHEAHRQHGLCAPDIRVIASMPGQTMSRYATMASSNSLCPARCSSRPCIAHIQ